MALNSDKLFVITIPNVGLKGTHSIMGGNWAHLRSYYVMEEGNVMTNWNEKCKNECESIRVCEQRREMCSWRYMTLFNKEECSTINEFLCRMSNYIVMSYRDVNVVTKIATRRTSKAKSIVM